MARQADTTGPSAEVVALMDLIIAVKDDKRAWRRVVGKPQYVPQRDEFTTRDESISCLVRAPAGDGNERRMKNIMWLELDLVVRRYAIGEAIARDKPVTALAMMNDYRRSAAEARRAAL